MDGPRAGGVADAVDATEPDGAVRNGDLTDGLALTHHERLTELKMRLLGDRVSRRTAWTIAREQPGRAGSGR
jgi:hypothetical protein